MIDILTFLQLAAITLLAITSAIGAILTAYVGHYGVSAFMAMLAATCIWMWRHIKDEDEDENFNQLHNEDNRK